MIICANKIIGRQIFFCLVILSKYSNTMLFSLLSLVSFAAPIAAVPHDILHDVYHQHLKDIDAKNIKPISIPERVGTSSNSGSYVIAVYNSEQCDADSVYTASGYVLDHCISLGTTSFMYSDCKTGGGQTTVTMTSCTSSDCKSGCMSFPMPLETGCKTKSIFSCSSSSEPWKDYPLNTHELMYWGDNDCSGDDFDQWVAVDVAEADCKNLDCYSNSTAGTDVSIEFHCDL